MTASVRRSREQLNEGLDHVKRSPCDRGPLQLIVRRPEVGARQILDQGWLDLDVGLVGDNWHTRGSMSRPDRSRHPDAQVTVMNARVAALVAGPIDRWGLAGDQLYVDLNLSEAQFPAGRRLSVGDAVIELTAKPHLGCAKFAERFGADALRFVNTGAGLDLNLRGRNARVVRPGAIRCGDSVQALSDERPARDISPAIG